MCNAQGLETDVGRVARTHLTLCCLMLQMVDCLALHQSARVLFCAEHAHGLLVLVEITVCTYVTFMASDK